MRAAEDLRRAASPAFAWAAVGKKVFASQQERASLGWHHMAFKINTHLEYAAASPLNPVESVRGNRAADLLAGQTALRDIFPQVVVLQVLREKQMVIETACAVAIILDSWPKTQERRGAFPTRDGARLVIHGDRRVLSRRGKGVACAVCLRFFQEVGSRPAWGKRGGPPLTWRPCQRRR